MSVISQIKKKLSECDNPKSGEYLSDLEKIVLKYDSGTEMNFYTAIYLKELKEKDIEVYIFLEKEIIEFVNYCRQRGMQL